MQHVHRHSVSPAAMAWQITAGRGSQCQ